MSAHVVPIRVYMRVFAALMVLFVLTVAIAFVDFQHLLPFTGAAIINDIVALLIAFSKAALVILFFMHVRYSSRLTWLFAIAGAVWLAILLALTLSDYFTRHWLT